MIRKIITYPTPIGIEYAPDVRVFDKELFSFIDDLKETIKSNDLEGLSATQVGSYYNLVILKKDDKFLEFINPRILKKKGKIQTTECTTYFPNASANLTRYEEITLVYEDRNGLQHSLVVDGDFAILLQRKTDYLYGANFLTKLKGNDKEKFETLLNSNGLNCPTLPNKFSRDYFVKVANVTMIVMLILLISSLLVDDKTKLISMWNAQLFLCIFVLITNMAYLFYSYYENKRYNICTNCYNMSILGITTIGVVRLTLIMVVSYFIIY